MKNSKSLLITLLSTGSIVFFSCEPKEKTVENEIIITDSTANDSVVIETYSSEELNTAEANWKEAEENLKRAIESGDKAAEAAAQKTRDDAKKTWENIKEKSNQTADAVEKGAKDAVEGAKNVANDVQTSHFQRPGSRTT